MRDRLRMNSRTITIALAVLALLVGASAPAVAKGRGVREKVEWAQLPPAVQATIESNTKGGKITAIEKRTRRGEVTYSAEVKLAADKILEIEVSADGKLLGLEEGPADD